MPWKHRALEYGVVLVMLIASTACVSWQRGWEMALPPATGVEVSGTIARANELALSADSRAKLEEAISLYDQTLAADPGNVEALVRLSEYNCLLAAAYSEKRREKARMYLYAIRCSERALYANPEFRRRIERGARVDEAAQVLTADEMEAMHFWVTSVSYYFKECLSPLRFPFNMKWMERSTAVLSRMQELDAGWNNGAVRFSWGIYYLALPRFAGGDMERSQESLEQTIKLAPESLLGRWGRAKYYHAKTKDRAAFIADLEWVVAQDPRSATSPYPWNVYFQRDAREMLARVDRIF